MTYFYIYTNKTESTRMYQHDMIDTTQIFMSTRLNNNKRFKENSVHLKLKILNI